MNQKEIDDKAKKAERLAELNALEPIDFDTLEKIVNEWMLVADTGIVKLLPAILIANKLNRDPIWMFLIGPSGGGKTELLQSLFDLPEIYSVSLLTPNTFLSGMPGLKDPSLLPQVDGKVLAFLDWTNILSMNKDARNEIMGQLRDIYGGHMKKIFGTGKIAEWNGKIGIVACTTPVIDFTQQSNASLGERFIHYRIAMPDRKTVAKRALTNGGKQTEMRIALRNAFYAFMKGIEIPEVIPSIPESAQDEIISVANFSTMARSGVIRDFGMKKDVIFVPASEMPTRIVQQLNTLAVALVIENKGEFRPVDMDIIYKIALDSIPQTNYMVMKEMARHDERTTSEIAASIGYPTPPIRIYLENLALLGVCDRIKGSDSEQGGNSDRWTLQAEFVEILKKYEDIKELEAEAVAAIEDALPPLDWDEPPKQEGLL
jgi:hypothetical protein